MKKVGSIIYIHISNIKELSEEHQGLIKDTIEFLPLDFTPEVIKIHKDYKISYIESRDWNTSEEPSVGDSYLVDVNGIIKLTKAKGQIYHHKWMFVSEDYKGFDVEKSRKRSETWDRLVPKELKCKIGYRNFWKEVIERYNIK